MNGKPRINRKGIFMTLVLVAFAGGWFAGEWFVSSYHRAQREDMQIRTRYQHMVLALSSADTNAVIALIAPDNRGAARRSLGVLANFTKPLGDRSSVTFSSAEARVCPERMYHFGVIPGGHTIDLVKVEGQWYFTGGVHVD